MSGLEFSIKGLDEQQHRRRDDRRGRVGVAIAVVASLFALASRPPPPVAVLAANPPRLDFGTQQLGTASAVRTVTLTSTGTKDFAADYDPTSADQQFTVTGCHPHSYETGADGGDCVLRVTFRPRSAGAREARLAVFEVDDAGKRVGAALVTIDLTGQAEPRPDVVPKERDPPPPAPGRPPPPAPAPAPPRLDAIPTELDFSSPRAANTVVLRNAGSAPVSISGASVTGRDAGRFRVDKNDCPAQPLAPGTQCTITLRHRAAFVATAHAAELVVNHTALDSPARIPLRWAAAPTPRVQAQPSSLAFGSVLLGARSSLSFTITNVGSVDAGNAFTLFTGDNDSFQLGQNQCRGTLAPQQQCTVEVVFAPSKAEPLEANLIVAGASISLSGVGQAPPGRPVPPAALQFVQPPAKPANNGPIIN